MLRRLINNKVSSKSLGIFRMVYGLVLLIEVMRLYNFRHLIYDNIPYFQPGEISFDYIFIVWFAVLALLIIGLKTRIASLLNYLLGLFLIGTVTSYEYHMFYTYMGINFMLLFIPSGRSFSLDNLIERVNRSTLGKTHIPEEKVSEFCYYVLVFFGVGIVYFDSVLYKTVSTMWMKGLGMWEPASVPFVANVNATALLNLEYVMKFLGYFTVVFEAVFIFTFWNRRLKIPYFIIGVGLHIGIYILFPIPEFALGVIGIYLLLLPYNYPERFKLPKVKRPLLFFYDNECPLCLRTKIVIEFFDVFKGVKFLPVQVYHADFVQLKDKKYDDLLDNIYSIDNEKLYAGLDSYIRAFKKMLYLYPLGLILQIPGIYHLGKMAYSAVARNRNTERCNEDNCEIGFGNRNPILPESKGTGYFSGMRQKSILAVFWFFVVLQLIVSLRSPLASRALAKIFVNRNFTERIITIKGFTKKLFGIANHGVFMESHFEKYNHIIKVDFVKQDKSGFTLPIIDDRGMPSDYLKNFNWIKWTFRVNHPDIEMDKMENGIRDFSAYWLNNTELVSDPMGHYDFKIYCKKIEAPNGFEKNFLNKQIAKPWIEIGSASWDKGVFTINLPNIERI